MAEVARRAVVVGAGRVGAALARTLHEEEWDVTVVDQSESGLNRLGAKWPGRFVLGHGMDRATLEEAGIEGADCLVAATNGDNTNILIAQVARKMYHVPRVAVRVLDPARADVYQRRGFEVVCPTAYAVQHLRGWLLREAPEGER